MIRQIRNLGSTIANSCVVISRSNTKLLPAWDLLWIGFLGVSWIGLPSTQLLAFDPPFVARAEMTNGKPYGVGMVEFSRKQALDSGWYFDQTIEVKCRQCKVWLPAVTERMATELKPSAETTDDEARLRVYFIYTGRFPKSVQVAFSGDAQISVETQRTASDQARHAVLLNEWWQALSDQTNRGHSTPLLEASNDFIAVLGGHFNLPIRKREASPSERTSQLESQFERTLGMLLGFESIRLAMMTDDATEPVGNSPAEFPLPSPVNVVGVRIPELGLHASHRTESIASMVPKDCFYVRCGSIRTYTWLRQLSINWGGSLNEIVTSPSLDTDVRGRIEAQLGVNSQQLLELGLDEHLSDLALIGTDVFFEEGAGIGVVLEAKPGHEADAERAVQQLRTAARKRSGATLRTETMNGHSVSVMGTEDHRVRSFFLRNGRYLFVTNSRELMRAFLNLKRSNQSLASLREYQYADANSPAAGQSDVKIYLSDPFFRRITSPAFRLELNRRRLAAKDCRKLEIAALVSSALGFTSSSCQSLVDNQFLHPDFGLHPDGSRVELVANEAMDSLRGRVGTFVPVADMKTDKANNNELHAYQKFAQRYREEWPAMDPVFACIQNESLAVGIDRIHLSIHVTPYARKEYGFLARYLASATSTQVAIQGNELMGVSAHLHNNSRQFYAHLGLCDGEIPFRVRRGELVREEGSSSGNLVQQQSFAAVTPAGRDGLELLAGLVKSLQNRDPKLTSQNPSPPLPPSATLSQGLNPFIMLRGVLNPAGVVLQLGDFAIHGLIDLAKLNSIHEDAAWSIYAANSKLRDQVRERLLQKDAMKPSQIHLQAGGIEQAAIAPYLHAYSYCDARQRSADNAAWLNRWTNGLHADHEVFREGLERALNGSLKCPLGGQFELQKKPGSTTLWTSSAWNETSLALVQDVPPEYRFPFLQWLKKLELDFNLTTTSLNSEIILEVARKVDRMEGKRP